MQTFVNTFPRVPFSREMQHAIENVLWGYVISPDVDMLSRGGVMQTISETTTRSRGKPVAWLDLSKLFGAARFSDSDIATLTMIQAIRRRKKVFLIEARLWTTQFHTRICTDCRMTTLTREGVCEGVRHRL